MDETLTFLGAAGARIMVANQIIPSGGLWLNLDGTQILVDPGPGTIVQSTKRKLRGDKLSAIILSHRHLDHSGDTNVMVEAMTQGGFKKGGRFFAPADALGEEPVLFSYLKSYLDEVVILEEGKSYSIGDTEFTTPVRHIHQVETYGLRFYTGGHTFSLITDTLYFDSICQHYRADLIVINVLFVQRIPTVNHLTLDDAETIIAEIKPKVAILNHFGMSMWRAKPWEVAENLTQKTGVKVLAARAGMTFDLAELDKDKS
jgi:phosphoribosyl 1,2-cyclic phosphodiesterase